MPPPSTTARRIGRGTVSVRRLLGAFCLFVFGFVFTARFWNQRQAQGPCQVPCVCHDWPVVFPTVQLSDAPRMVLEPAG